MRVKGKQVHRGASFPITPFFPEEHTEKMQKWPMFSKIKLSVSRGLTVWTQQIEKKITEINPVHRYYTALKKKHTFQSCIKGDV